VCHSTAAAAAAVLLYRSACSSACSSSIICHKHDICHSAVVVKRHNFEDNGCLYNHLIYIMIIYIICFENINWQARCHQMLMMGAARECGTPWHIAVHCTHTRHQAFDNAGSYDSSSINNALWAQPDSISCSSCQDRRCCLFSRAGSACAVHTHVRDGAPSCTTMLNTLKCVLWQ
jgi:hypothetical protein